MAQKEVYFCGNFPTGANCLMPQKGKFCYP